MGGPASRPTYGLPAFLKDPNRALERRARAIVEPLKGLEGRQVYRVP